MEASFGFLGGLCLFGAAFAAIAVREAARTDAEVAVEDVEWTLRDSRLWILSAGSGLYLFAQIALMSFIVLFLHDVHGLSDGAAAGALAAMQVGAVITRISAGRISDAMRARVRPLRWVGLASFAGVLLTALLANAPVAVIVPVMVVAGAISMAWNGLSVTAAAELAGLSRSGAAIGFQQTTLSVIGVAVPRRLRVRRRCRFLGGRLRPCLDRPAPWLVPARPLARDRRLTARELAAQDRGDSRQSNPRLVERRFAGRQALQRQAREQERAGRRQRRALHDPPELHRERQCEQRHDIGVQRVGAKGQTRSARSPIGRTRATKFVPQRSENREGTA